MTSFKRQKGVIDPISIIAGLFLVVTLIVGTVVVNDRGFSLNIAERAGLDGGMDQLTGNSSGSNVVTFTQTKPKPTEKANECEPNCSGKTCGSNGCGGTCGTCATGQSCSLNGQCTFSCDVNGRQYPSDTVAVYGGIGDYRKCINGRWEECPTCQITDLNVTPVYLEGIKKEAEVALADQQAEQSTTSKFCNVSIVESFCGNGTNNCTNGFICHLRKAVDCSQKIEQTTTTCTISDTGQTVVNTRECNSGSKVCDGNTLRTCSQNGFWIRQNCQYGCLNNTCISSVSTGIEVNRDDEGTTRDLTVIVRDENQDVITASTNPITINTQSPTIEKTDDGFIKTVTTVINNADTGEIINAITQNIASIKKTNGDYCSYDGECNSGKCDFAGTPVRRCVPNVTQLEMAYNGLETLTFGTFGDYVNAYQNPYMAWQIQGFDSSRDFIEDCIARNGISAAQNCTRQASALSQDALASSTALGTVITSEVALLGTGVSYLSGGLTGVQALYQGLAISSLYQTGSAVDICNTNPDSIECRDAKIWAAISWINVGTAANLVNNATQGAKLLNSGVNAINLIGDVYLDVGYNCVGANKNDLGCALAVGATVLDFGGGAFDLMDMVKPTKVAQALTPLQSNHVDVGVDVLTDGYNGAGIFPSNIEDGALGFSNDFLTNNPPVVSPIDGLVNALEASGVNLSFPDVTINNWANSLADTIAHSPITGDISVTTLDTAILPDTPTSLDNVLAQTGSIPTAAVIPDTPNVPANPPLLTRIEDWANNNIPWIFGSGSPSVSPLTGDTTNIKPEKINIDRNNSQTLAEAVKVIDPNDIIKVDLKSYQQGSALHKYTPEKNIKIALENVPDPINIIKTVNSNTPEEALDKIKKILTDRGVVIVEDPLDPRYQFLVNKNAYNKNINDPSQNIGTYVTDGYVRINDEAGNELIFLPNNGTVTSYIFLHPEFNTLPIERQLKTFAHESGHYVEEVVLDGAIENIEGIDGLVKPATEYISTLYGTHAALSTSDPISAGLVQQLKLNAQVLGYPDEYLNIAQPNWFQQNIYSPDDGFLPAVKNWWDDTFGGLFGSGSPANDPFDNSFKLDPKTTVKFSENESTDKLVKFIVGDEVTKAEDLALKIQNDQQAIINEYSLPSYTTRFNNPQQYLAELLKIADEKGIIIKVDPATKHIYHDSGVITLRTIESYSDSDLKKLVHELTHALDFKSKKVFSPEQSEYRAYIVDLGDAVAVEKALGDNFVDFLFGGFGVKGSVEKYYKDIGVKDMPWLNNNISIPEKNIPFIQRVQDWFDDTFGGIGGSGSPSVSPLADDEAGLFQKSFLDPIADYLGLNIAFENLPFVGNNSIVNLPGGYPTVKIPTDKGLTILDSTDIPEVNRHLRGYLMKDGTFVITFDPAKDHMVLWHDYNLNPSHSIVAFDANRVQVDSRHNINEIIPEMARRMLEGKISKGFTLNITGKYTGLGMGTYEDTVENLVKGLDPSKFKSYQLYSTNRNTFTNSAGEIFTIGPGDRLRSNQSGEFLITNISDSNVDIKYESGRTEQTSISKFQNKLNESDFSVVRMVEKVVYISPGGIYPAKRFLNNKTPFSGIIDSNGRIYLSDETLSHNTLQDNLLLTNTETAGRITYNPENVGDILIISGSENAVNQIVNGLNNIQNESGSILDSSVFKRFQKMNVHIFTNYGKIDIETRLNQAKNIIRTEVSIQKQLATTTIYGKPVIENDWIAKDGISQPRFLDNRNSTISTVTLDKVNKLNSDDFTDLSDVDLRFEISGSSADIKYGHLKQNQSSIPVVIKVLKPEFTTDLPNEIIQAQIADQLGIGPKIYGWIEFSDGRVGYVMDAVNGKDISQAPRLWITDQTISDLREIDKILKSAGYVKLDTSALVTPNGRAILIDAETLRSFEDIQREYPHPESVIRSFDNEITKIERLIEGSSDYTSPNTNLFFDNLNGQDSRSGQVSVVFSNMLPTAIAIPAAGLYFADQYFDLGIVDAMTSSINEALESTQNKSSNVTDPVYDTVNFWANTASVIYAINNDKELSEIAINNPDQRPYDEIIQEAIDNYTANNPGSDIYYSPNPNALSLTDIFKQTFNKDSLEIISTTLANEEFKKLSLSGKIMELSNNLLTDRNTFIDSVVGAAANIGLFTKDGGTYPIIGFENKVVNLTAIIESEVENTGNPVSHSFVIEYFLDKNNGDLSQAILDSSNFEEFLTRSLDGEIVDDPYVWIQNHILDEYSPILPYHVLSTNEEVLENSQIYYDYSLPNRLGQVYHAANITALLNYLPPEVIRAMVIGEYLSYGEKHGLIKMSADLEILKRLDDINDLLKSYEQSNN